MVTENLNLEQLYAGIFTEAASIATAPLLALGVGILLFLLCDIVGPLRSAKKFAFLATIGVALATQVRILMMDQAPGAVLDGTFSATPATAMLGCVFLMGALLAWAYGQGYYIESAPFKAEHDALILSSTAGMLLMVGATDWIVFFVGLELLSIPLYALAAFKRSNRASVEAGVKYFLLGAFSSGLFLYGASLYYVSTGSLSLGALAGEAATAPMTLAGLALISASLFFKVSVFPFHMWVPDVYQGSPTPVTALMATGTKAAAFGFLVIQLMPILPASAASQVGVLALITMALGNLGALVQPDLKRMLSYSGIAHAGALLLIVAGGLASGDTEGPTQAVVFYMVAYLFSAMGAFGILSLLEADGSQFTKLKSLRGLSQSRPALAAALALFMLSLGGIPATGGFLGKYFAFMVLVQADMIGIAMLGALMSVIALGYYLRVIVALYMQSADEGQEAPTTTRPLSAGLATVICAVFVLLTGLLPGLFLGPLA